MSGTTEVLFDGCMFGMEANGLRLNKPWRLVTNSVHVHDRFLGYLCDRKHAHGQCRGNVALASGRYNANIASAVHEAFGKECRKLGSRMKARSRVVVPESVGCGRPAVAAVGNAVWNATEQCEVQCNTQDWGSCVQEFLDAVRNVTLSLSVQRTNVYESGSDLRGELLGCYTCRGAGVTTACEKPEWVRVVTAVHALAKFREGERRGAPYLAIQVNKICSGHGMRKHIDKHNGGWSDVIALGEHTGGEFVTDQGEFDCRERWV
eukprot:994772-Amphidinium_carterae.1